MYGPDGAGKTYFLDHFVEDLKKSGIKEKDIAVFHFRPSVFPNIKKLLLGKDLTPMEMTNPHRSKPSNEGISLFRMIYYWLDYCIGYYISVRPLVQTGKIVIFDRYIYDIYVDPVRSKIKLPQKILKFFADIAPQMDVSFVMICDPDIIYERKQELNKEEICRQIAMYKELVKSKKSFYEFDSSRDVMENIYKARKIIGI